MKPRVSVVVPVLNEERYLEATLLSLRNQSFRDFELIVVDNGSVDLSPQIAQRYADKVLWEAQRGSPWAMHRGFSEAKGEFVATADADTLYPSHWLETMIKALDRPGVVGVYGPIGFRESGTVGRWLQVAGYTLLVGCCRLLGVHLVGASNFGVRREAYFAVGGYPPVAHWASSDVRLAQRLTRLGQVRFVPTLVCWTSNRRFAHKEGTWRIFRAWLDVVLRQEKMTLEEYWGIRGGKEQR